MSEKIETETISRRRIFRLLGLNGGVGIRCSNPVPASFVRCQGQTKGMERRQERRASARRTVRSGAPVAPAVAVPVTPTIRNGHKRMEAPDGLPSTCALSPDDEMPWKSVLCGPRTTTMTNARLFHSFG